MPGESRPPFAPGNDSGQLSRGGRPRKTEDVREAEALAKEKSRRAVERLAEIMESDDLRAAKAACDSILDRALGKAPQSVAVDLHAPPLTLDAAAVIEVIRVEAARIRALRQTPVVEAEAVVLTPALSAPAKDGK